MLAVDFLNISEFKQSAVVFGKLVKNDRAFSSQARIQVGRLAQGSIVGSSCGSKPPHPRHFITHPLPHPSQ